MLTMSDLYSILLLYVRAVGICIEGI